MLVPVAAAFLVSAFGAEAFRRWALARLVLDIPNQRSSHRVPTPRGGGVGIVAGFLAGLLVWLVLLGGSLSPRALGWLCGALIVAGVSFLDDLRPLPAWLRLGVHLLAAGLLTIVGVQEREQPLLLAIPLAFAWIVLVTNIYNFMDGIDGLAGAQAIVAGIALAVAGWLVGNPLVMAAASLLAAASAGFLVHNLPPPARLFMGDVASTFLGFSFAGLTLLGSLGVGGGRLPVELGAIVLAPFLFDGLLTLARRVLRRERWFEAHRSHYYQRLVSSGLTHGQVTALYTALAALAAAAGLLSLVVGPPLGEVLTILAFAPMLGVVALVWRLERSSSRAVSLVHR
jgi:UDP-N-acetylmuramyl pentapeptide phosphotransferase/UDP-N-acetylglucosamine-1-phosphate transferase